MNGMFHSAQAALTRAYGNELLLSVGDIKVHSTINSVEANGSGLVFHTNDGTYHAPDGTKTVIIENLDLENCKLKPIPTEGELITVKDLIIPNNYRTFFLFREYSIYPCTSSLTHYWDYAINSYSKSDMLLYPDLTHVWIDS